MNLISAYNNPSIEESKMPRDLVEGKITLESSTIIWDYDDSKGYVSPITGGYSLEEIKKTKLDFIINFNNLRKYPKMTEKDWE